MRKTFAVFLAVVLLISALPAAAAGYEKTALDFLSAKYGVSAGQIQLHAGILTLEHTGETFWSARYVIYPEGTQVPPENEIKPETRILPADTPVSDQGPGPETEGGTIFGAIHIREKTGEIYMITADRRIAARTATERVFEHMLYVTVTEPMAQKAAADTSAEGSAPANRNDAAANFGTEENASLPAQTDETANTAFPVLWLLAALCLPAGFWGVKRTLFRPAK